VHRRDEDVIALTHVCRAWREIFTSCSSLWTEFYCRDEDKTRVYLKRSKSSLISLWTNKEHDISPYDPLLQVIPLATGRLKSLCVNGSPENLPDITIHLTHPAPFLEHLSIDGGCESSPESSPTLATSLFDGDLSSLRELWLQSVRTELPWRNMVNLTSFTLCNVPPGEVSVQHLLDFFENAPRLCQINLDTPTTSGVQEGRLVSLTYLKKMRISGDVGPSILLNHLLVPVGAKLLTRKNVPGPLFEGHLPRSLDNLRNFSDFTKIHLGIDSWCPHVRFSGSNGQVHMFSLTPPGNPTCLVFEYLARFNTSKTERLRIDRGYPPSSDLIYRALLPMKDLRALTLYRCRNPNLFIHALDPGADPSGIVVCPKLEEFVLVPGFAEEIRDIESLVGMVAARASRGAKLKSVRIHTNGRAARWFDASELEKRVLHVECDPVVTVADDDRDSSDEGY